MLSYSKCNYKNIKAIRPFSDLTKILSVVGFFSFILHPWWVLWITFCKLCHVLSISRAVCSFGLRYHLLISWCWSWTRHGSGFTMWELLSEGAEGVFQSLECNSHCKLGFLSFSTLRVFSLWALSIELCVKSCSPQTEPCRSLPGCCKYGSKTTLPSASPEHLAKLMLEHYKPAAVSPFCASWRVCCYQMAEISLTLSPLKLCASFLALALELTKTSLSSAFPHRGYSVSECGESFALLLGESRMGLPCLSLSQKYFSLHFWSLCSV